MNKEQREDGGRGVACRQPITSTFRRGKGRNETLPSFRSLSGRRFFFALCSLLLVLSSPLRAQSSITEISDALEYRPQPFDVLHYDAELDLMKAPLRQMTGVCTITLRWVGPVDSEPFRFHLRGLKVDSVFYDGVAVAAVEVGQPDSPAFHYTILPPSTPGIGDTALVRMYYSGTMTAETPFSGYGGVISRTGTLYAMGVSLHTDYVSSTRHWLPCYDHPSDKASTHFRFKVKKGTTALSNGLDSVSTSGDTSIFDWRHDVPCATYLYMFAVSTYHRLDFPGAGTPISVYARAADTGKSRSAFKFLPRMLNGFERRFIPFPFERLGYALTPSGAMEHETMISFPDFAVRANDTVNGIAAHEMAHQWFGDLVSPRDFRHAWLTESFSEFCDALWIEELFGHEVYLDSLSRKARKYIDTIAPVEGRLPLSNFPRKAPSSNYPATIYQKGAVVVGMLRYELGDSIFYRAIREYLTTFAYGTATATDLLMMLEKHAGRSLGWFFEQWVYRRGWPVVSVSIEPLPTPGQVRVTLEQQETGLDSLYTNLPVELGFDSGTGSPVYRLLRMTRRIQTFDLDSIPAAASVTINRGPSVRTLMKLAPAPSGITTVADSGDVRITIHPNPSASNASFKVQVHGKEDCKDIRYDLFESTGRRLLIGYAQTCEFTIPTAGFSSGAYVIRFRLDNLFYDVSVIIAK